jgi:hypothetical protein
MTEREFWRCVPRKLYALMDVHTGLHGGGKSGGEKKEKPEMGYIDQVL